MNTSPTSIHCGVASTEVGKPYLGTRGCKVFPRTLIVDPSPDHWTVVIPCFNEEKRLQQDLFIAAMTIMKDIHFLLVNDGSSDGTLDLLIEIQGLHPAQVTVLNKPANEGKAEAVRDGINLALATQVAGAVAFWDADLAVPLEEVLQFQDVFARRPSLQVVLGSRVRLLGHDIERKPVRHYLGRCFATAASLVLRLPIYDTQCGAKAFRITPELREVFASRFLSRWIFDVEILARLIEQHDGDRDFLRHHVCEYPVQEFRDVRGSRVKPFDFIAAAYDLYQIKNNYRLSSTSPKRLKKSSFTDRVAK